MDWNGTDSPKHIYTPWFLVVGTESKCISQHFSGMQLSHFRQLTLYSKQRFLPGFFVFEMGLIFGWNNSSRQLLKTDGIRNNTWHLEWTGTSWNRLTGTVSRPLENELESLLERWKNQLEPTHGPLE